MDKIQIVLDHDQIVEERLIADLRAKFPVLAGAHIAILKAGGRLTLEIISSSVDVDEIKKIISAHAPASRNGGGDVIVNVKEKQVAAVNSPDVEFEPGVSPEEIEKINDVIARVPGVKNAILAAMEVMAQVSSISSIIVGKIDPIEKSIANLQSSVTTIEECVDANTASLDSKISKARELLEKKIDESAKSNESKSIATEKELKELAKSVGERIGGLGKEIASLMTKIESLGRKVDVNLSVFELFQEGLKAGIEKANKEKEKASKTS